MKKVLALLVLASSLVGLATPAMADKTEIKTFSGMEMNSGTLCSNAATAMDLITVINDRQMFVDWFHGYDVSGYCGQATGLEFTLVQKWKAENVSFDGYKAEMWTVRMSDGALMFAIVFPQYLRGISGVGS